MPEHVTFCRICEAHCGMVATVQDGKVVKLRPDKEQPLSQGYACPKGIAMLDVHNDPDRVTHPLRRRADGEGFERISWETAIAEIGGRLRGVRARTGAGSIGWYMGNPGAFSYSHPIWVKGFLDGLGSQHYYTASSQDVSNRFAASALLYGSPLVVPIPDLQRTDFLLIVGANPLVSHGSVLTAPRVKDQLHAITARGGRVIVADPRRSETARAFEHLPVRPDTDAWFLLSLLHVLFADGLADESFLATATAGAAGLRANVAPFAPERTEARTGIPAATVRALAHDLAGAPSAAVYGRTGSCLGRFGTLVSFLLDSVMAVTGNLDRPGGGVFGRPAAALDEVAEKTGLATYGARRSRVGGFPDVIGALPASLIPQEITTPGEGALRALIVSAGNPVLSVPDGEAMREALAQLDLFVSIDLYVNETNAIADYILPATTFLEREDLPLAFLGFHTTPFVQWTEPVVAPRGEARDEWETIEALAAELGIVPSSDPRLRSLRRFGLRITPRRMVDLLIRTGPEGDRFGLRRGGLRLSRLQAAPHGIVTAPHIATGVLGVKVRHPDGRLRLDPPVLRGEIARLQATGDGAPGEYPLLLIGLRELRSHNSWMHNAPLLMRGGREHTARVHPDDAAALGVAEGDEIRIVSKAGEVRIAARLTDEVMPGVLAVPHGWGHTGGGWRLANEAGGQNVNVLASGQVEDLEPLAGMAFLNGIPVRVERIAPAASPAGDAVAAAG